MNRIYLTALFFVIMLSCSDHPSNVLSEKKMVALMADMEIAEAYVNTQGNISNSQREDIGRRVLMAHGVSEETLDTTLAWYGRNIDKYSELFEKVDKEILKRQKEYTSQLNGNQKGTDNLWAYNEHLVISPLSGSESFNFNILHPELEKGEIVKLSLYLPNSASIKGTLGVEYSDGFGETVISNFSKNKDVMELHTDSSKTVTRIFGTMSLKENTKLPLYIDSISITGEPIDTLVYRNKRRNQKHFGPLD